MADVVSSDGHCTVRLHTAWAAVLVWTDLTGTITVRRNGVAAVTLGASRMIWYDGFPPIGVATAYTVTNGSTTSTSATITVPATAGMTWVKPANDPTLSVQVRVATYGDVVFDQEQGVFPVINSPTPFVVFGAATKRKRSVGFLAMTAAVRDKLASPDGVGGGLQSGPVYVAHHPGSDEGTMWAAASKPTVTRQGSVSPGVVWTVKTELTEVAIPTGAADGSVIPGWSWDTVKATYATHDAMEAANATYAALLRAGVS